METLDRLIKMLCDERGENVPALDDAQKPDYFRALCNVRPPMPVSKEFLTLQDEYLTEQKEKKGTVRVQDLQYKDNITLFLGDITTLDADAIVNAANSQMLGCFHPLHNCIDNAIHSTAGVQVRLDCNDIMRGAKARNGDVIVTKAYNLPSKFIFHTVGPIVQRSVSETNRKDLQKCYVNCLEKAEEIGVKSIAFCCISTGVFGYPKEDAAKIAVSAVKEFLAQNHGEIKVIFNVFSEADYAIYKRLLG